MKRIRSLISAAVLLSALLPAIAFICSMPSHSQQSQLPRGTAIIGMLNAQGSAPTVTGGTLTAGSTDGAGQLTASATSGTIVFNFATFANAPFCVVVDQSASPVAVYAVTATQITLTTIVSGHLYQYHCYSRIL